MAKHGLERELTWEAELYYASSLRNFHQLALETLVERGTDKYGGFLRRIAMDEQRIRAYARRLLPDWNSVDDVMQEAYLVAWKKFDAFEGDNFLRWMCVIIRFESLKFRRKYARSLLVFDEDLMSLLAGESGPDESYAVHRDALETCLKILEPSQHRLIMAFYSATTSTRELAEQTGKSENSIYKNLRRIRAKLSACIQQQCLGYE